MAATSNKTSFEDYSDQEIESILAHPQELPTLTSLDEAFTLAKATLKFYDRLDDEQRQDRKSNSPIRNQQWGNCLQVLGTIAEQGYFIATVSCMSHLRAVLTKTIRDANEDIIKESSLLRFAQAQPAKLTSFEVYRDFINQTRLYSYTEIEHTEPTEAEFASLKRSYRNLPPLPPIETEVASVGVEL